MLFGYPVSATVENWLHECLIEMIQSIHARLLAGQQPLKWPEIVPKQHRNKLENRRGLRDGLAAYQNALKKLSSADQNRVLKALTDQNEIALLLPCEHDCEIIDELPEGIRQPVKTLFKFAFTLLTEFEIRDGLYKIIYDAIPAPVCPFCGLEYFEAPSAPREDLDHYLVFKKYPFAGANLRNLAPIGKKCNSQYKRTQDMHRNNDGTRRISFDPYKPSIIITSLENSLPFAGANGELPEWQIDFYPDIPEIITWDQVFQIRIRYRRDVLDAMFKNWLGCFGGWYRDDIGNPPATDADLLNAIRKYIKILNSMNHHGHDFLREPVFEMLYKHCQQGNQRLIAIIKDVIPIS